MPPKTTTKEASSRTLKEATKRAATARAGALAARRRRRRPQVPANTLSNKNVIVIDQRKTVRSRQPGDKTVRPLQVPQTVFRGGYPDGFHTLPLAPHQASLSDSKSAYKQVKELIDRGVLEHNNLLESALRKNSELLQNDINKRTFQSPLGPSYTPDPQHTPATKTLMGIEAIREYLKQHKDAIPMNKKYKDSDIDGLMANQLLKLYEVTKRDVNHFAGDEDISIAELNRLMRNVKDYEATYGAPQREDFGDSGSKSV